RDGDRRGGQRLVLFQRSAVRRGLDRAVGSERARYEPRIAREQQQPEGDWDGRGRLDGQALHELLVHRLARRNGHRRDVRLAGDRDLGRRRRQLDDVLRDRYRRRWQRLVLLVGRDLRRGLDRAELAFVPRFEPSVAGERQ